MVLQVSLLDQRREKTPFNVADAPTYNTPLFSFYNNPFSSISITRDEVAAKALMSVGLFEPTPFKDGAYLQALSGEDQIFVPTDDEMKVLPSATTHHGYHHQQRHLSTPAASRDFTSDSVQDKDSNIAPSTDPTKTFSRPSCNPKCFQHQEDRWDEHYQELLRYKKRHGHCHIPQNYQENLSLARWARRQRHQYKRRRLNKRSTLSEKRQRLLEWAGFIWDPQMDVWEIRRQELEEYKRKHGHCNVPSRYSENPKLATWVKRQRRQYKQLQRGTPSRLPRERFAILSSMGFVWKHRDSAPMRPSFI